MRGGVAKHLLGRCEPICAICDAAAQKDKGVEGEDEKDEAELHEEELVTRPEAEQLHVAAPGLGVETGRVAAVGARRWWGEAKGAPRRRVR